MLVKSFLGRIFERKKNIRRDVEQYQKDDLSWAHLRVLKSVVVGKTSLAQRDKVGCKKTFIWAQMRLSFR